MALTKITQNDIDTNNVKSADDTTTGEPEDVKNVFDKLPEVIANKFNALIDNLMSTIDGSSGADNIGVTTISGVTGNTAQTVLEGLKTVIDNAVLGQIPDNTLTDAKLGSDIKVGSLALLTTTEKGSLVGAVNENVTNITTLNTSFNTHTSDLVNDSDGVHGLKIEEGIWTPYIAGQSTSGTFVYSLQAGSYKRIDDLVIAWFNVAISSISVAPSGGIQIMGLPFTPSSGNEQRQGSTISKVEKILLDSGYTQFVLQIEPNVPKAYIFEIGSNLSEALVNSSGHIVAGSAVGGCLIYKI